MDDARDTGVHAALASPVRRHVLHVLRSADGPTTARQLATRLSLHVTTVRFHLDQLEAAGLVAWQTEHVPRRGRPAALYRAVGPQPDPGQAQEQMIDALAEALAGADTAGAERPVLAGRRWADRIVIPDADPTAAVTAVFTRLGFDPEPDGDVIRLHACPFREAARRHPEVVCRVHLGLAQRLVELAVGNDRVRVDLAPFVEPELCLLRLDHAAS